MKNEGILAEDFCKLKFFEKVFETSVQQSKTNNQPQSQPVAAADLNSMISSTSITPNKQIKSAVKADEQDLNAKPALVQESVNLKTTEVDNLINFEDIFGDKPQENVENPVDPITDANCLNSAAENQMMPIVNDLLLNFD